MRIAHLVICHIYPEQVIRLVRMLAHPDADVYVHIDRKTDAAPFAPLAAIPHVYLVQERVRVHWGGYSIVQATMSGFAAILGSGKKYDYINLLSGQDYPLQPPEAINKYLAGNNGRLLMNIFPEWNNNKEHQHRLQQYYFAGIGIRGKYTAERIAKKLYPRKFPDGFVPVGRSQWFTIPTECAAYILKFVAENKKIVRLFKYMWAPDEMMFQSILYNSPYRTTITNDNLRFADWSGQQPSPRVLTMADAERLTTSGNLYARKFDITVDSEILDLLDRHIANFRQLSTNSNEQRA